MQARTPVSRVQAMSFCLTMLPARRSQPSILLYIIWLLLSEMACLVACMLLLLRLPVLLFSCV